MWLQNDWVHEELRVPGAEIFPLLASVMPAARDLARRARGADVRLDLARIHDPGLAAAVHDAYPEAVPGDRATSCFDAA